ncbi:MAG: peptidyl-prolyl cis-trans isomerase [Neptuniibacter sp.]
MLKSLLLSVIVVLTFTAKSWAEGSNPVVDMQTNLGSITLELFPEQSPETVKNFLSYVDEGFYEGLIFHRTIVGFMIQGGGFNKELVLKKPKSPVINESQNGLSNKAGTIAMARTRHPHSATSQFFINAVSNRNLDAQGSRFGYTVFGRVTKGMDLVMKISRLPTAPQGMHRDVPVEPIIIEKIVRVEPKASTSAND